MFFKMTSKIQSRPPKENRCVSIESDKRRKERSRDKLRLILNSKMSLEIDGGKKTLRSSNSERFYRAEAIYSFMDLMALERRALCKTVSGFNRPSITPSPSTSTASSSTLSACSPSASRSTYTRYSLKQRRKFQAAIRPSKLAKRGRSPSKYAKLSTSCMRI